MKRLLTVLFLFLLMLPLHNQTDKSDKKDKKGTQKKTEKKYEDVFDKRDPDDMLLDNEDPGDVQINFVEDKKELPPLSKKEKIVWGFRNIKEDPFL